MSFIPPARAWRKHQSDGCAALMCPSTSNATVSRLGSVAAESSLKTNRELAILSVVIAGSHARYELITIS